MSNIEWTDKSWNPIVGCSVVSPGCTNCYAMRDAWIRHHNPKTPHYRGLTFRGRLGTKPPHWTGKVARAPESVWLAPLKRRTPTVYFVNSMGDLFHESVPDEWIDQAFAIMALCPQHVFQILTKRPERMRAYFEDQEHRYGIAVALGNMLDGEWIWGEGKRHRPTIEGMIALAHGLAPDCESLAREAFLPLPNVWLGVSAEDQPRFDERVPILEDTPAAVRFVSLEPLLGPVDARSALGVVPLASTSVCAKTGNLVGEIEIGWTPSYNVFTRECAHPSIDWVIVGGESGPGARPMHPDWARTLRDQCAAAGVPFFFKQWGAFAPLPAYGGVFDQSERGQLVRAGDQYRAIPWQISTSASGGLVGHFESMVRVGKKSAGRTLDGRTHDDMAAGVRLEKVA